MAKIDRTTLVIVIGAILLIMFRLGFLGQILGGNITDATFSGVPGEGNCGGAYTYPGNGGDSTSGKIGTVAVVYEDGNVDVTDLVYQNPYLKNGVWYNSLRTFNSVACIRRSGNVVSFTVNVPQGSYKIDNPLFVSTTTTTANIIGNIISYISPTTTSAAGQPPAPPQNNLMLIALFAVIGAALRIGGVL